MTLTLLIFPFMAALTAWLIPSNRWRPWAIPVAGIIHFPLTLGSVFFTAQPVSSEWIGLDPAGRLVLLMISLIYLITSFYLAGYLR